VVIKPQPQRSSTSPANSLLAASGPKISREEEVKDDSAGKSEQENENEEVELWWEKKNAPCCDRDGEEGKGKGEGCTCVMMETLRR